MATRWVRDALGPWTSIAVVAAVTAILMRSTGLGVDWMSLLLPAAVCLGCEALSLLYRTWRPDPRLASALTALAQLVAFSAVAGCLSYAAARMGGPLRDETLSCWDRALGLDWRAYLAFVDHRPWLALIFGRAYASFPFQLMLMPVALGFTGRTRELGDFVLAFALAALAAILVSALMPAHEMYVHLGLHPFDAPNIPPTGAYARAAILDGLRDGTLGTVSLGRIEGIITFPSFHAAVGVIVAAMLWPMRLLRWPVIALDALMVAATPIYGGHYFVDVMAGATVAALAVAAARARGRRSAVDALPCLDGLAAGALP